MNRVAAQAGSMDNSAMTLTLSHLSLYPVKSCAAITLTDAVAGPRGLLSGRIGDRRWMLVDAAGDMVSQRVEPAMARIRTFLLHERGEAIAVQLGADRGDPLVLQPGVVIEGRRSLRMFGREVVGHAVGAAADQWFSQILGRAVTLIHQTEDDLRDCEQAFRLSADDRVGFADAYPFLLANPATLARLNQDIADPVPIDRFRANLLVAGAEADAEYGWGEIAIGAAHLALVKPCTRCQVTTIDQALGQRSGTEPLAALGRRYLLKTGEGASRIQGAVFGENAIARICGVVRVGDRVTVTRQRPPHQFSGPTA
jgi:uncharacterized protein YcbX